MDATPQPSVAPPAESPAPVDPQGVSVGRMGEMSLGATASSPSPAPFRGGRVNLDNFEDALCASGRLGASMSLGRSPSVASNSSTRPLLCKPLSATVGASAGQFGQLLTSPRSIEVCARFGILESELMPPRPRPTKAASGTPAAVLQRRWDHKEERRQQKLEVLRTERANLIALQLEEEAAAVSMAADEAGQDASLSLGRRTLMGPNGAVSAVDEKVSSVLTRRDVIDAERRAAVEAKTVSTDALAEAAAKKRQEENAAVASKLRAHGDHVARATSAARGMDAELAARKKADADALDESRAAKASTAADRKFAEAAAKTIDPKLEAGKKRAAERYALTQQRMLGKVLAKEEACDQVADRQAQFYDARADKAGAAEPRREANRSNANAIFERTSTAMRSKVTAAEAEAEARLQSLAESRMWAGEDESERRNDHADEVRRVARAITYERSRKANMLLASQVAVSKTTADGRSVSVRSPSMSARGPSASLGRSASRGATMNMSAISITSPRTLARLTSPDRSVRRTPATESAPARSLMAAPLARQHTWGASTLSPDRQASMRQESASQKMVTPGRASSRGHCDPMAAVPDNADGAAAAAP